MTPEAGQVGRKPESLMVDAIVVGAGFAGMYMLYRLRQCGLTVRVYEAGGGVGGTWYWNRYPGARCDTPSLEYSDSFSDELQQEWDWSERYSGQDEIENYANHVADRFDLRRDIQFDTRVMSAHLMTQQNAAGLSRRTAAIRVSNKILRSMATGGYSIPAKPEIKGIDSFEGETYYTACWPRNGGLVRRQADRRYRHWGEWRTNRREAVAQEDIGHLVRLPTHAQLYHPHAQLSVGCRLPVELQDDLRRSPRPSPPVRLRCR